ncbi:MAG: hypothetical protein GX117_02750 [Candidatus Hydrogenedentes bacterium]|nr:hypothetical protein [Candidatus Hydrogenedentota bacterium]
MPYSTPNTNESQQIQQLFFDQNNTGSEHGATVGRNTEIRGRESMLISDISMDKKKVLAG